MLSSEFTVLYTDHDATLKGLVEGVDTVCRKDHVTVVLLQDAHELTDQFAALVFVFVFVQAAVEIARQTLSCRSRLYHVSQLVLVLPQHPHIRPWALPALVL